MKKLLAVLLACALLLSAVPLYASAKSGKLDEALAAETRALAVEIEAEVEEIVIEAEEPATEEPAAEDEAEAEDTEE